MLVDLVHVVTSDGLRLHGALELGAAGQVSTSPQAPSPVDAWLCIHGTGSNFYAASTLAGLAPKLAAGGAAVLRANTRGHDLISSGSSLRGPQGAAFERVDESPLDLTTWIDFLIQRGFDRIGLLGHSLGAVKAVFTLAAEDAPRVAALAAISPPRLSYSAFRQSTRGQEFLETFSKAETLVAEGRGDELLSVRVPISYYVTAAGYVERYGPPERFNVLKLLARVKCPTLVTYGSSELAADVAFSGMAEDVQRLATPANRLQVAVIAGADHIYTACHDSLAARIASWLGRLPPRG